MKKILLASVVVLVVAAGSGGWYILQHRDPLQQAKALLAKGDYRAANLQLRTAVRDQPDNAEAHALLSQLQLASDDPIAAEREIRQAMALHWDQSSSLAVLSQSLMRQGKWKEILASIPDHGATPEQTAYFLMTRAVAQRGDKDPAGANATLAEAERLAPQNAEVHLTAARFALADSHQDQAMDQVDRALALEPQRADALQFKAGLLTLKGDRDGAITQLGRAIDTAPARDDLVLERASLLLEQNKDDKASADVDTVLKRDSKNVIAQYINAVLLIRQNKFAEADTILQQIDPVITQFRRGQYFKAMVKSRTGQEAQAEDTIVAYVNRVPNDPDGVRLLAAIELAVKRPDRAIPYLTKAVEAGQRDSETLDLLGRSYALAGNQSAAAKAFQQASQSAQTPAQLARLASARLQLGDLSGAAADLQHSLDIAPRQPGAGEALVATAIRLGQLDRAQQALDNLRQQEGKTESVGNLSGLLKLARLDAEGALADFAETARLFPDSIPARLNQIKVLLQLNRANDAMPMLQAILDKNPAQTEALTLMVQTLLAQNRPQDAIDAAERARKTDPTNLGLINGEAQIYGRLKQYDKALQVLDSAKVDGKIPAQLLGTLGSIQLANGQTDAAKQTFADLVKSDPNNIGAILAQVELLTRVKDFDAAKRTLDESIQRTPGNLVLLQARVRVDLLDQGLDAALQTAERLRATPANLPAAATLKGGMLMGAQRYKDAADAFEAEYRREPSATLVVALAQAKQAAGDPAGASTLLRQWQALHPDDAAVAQALGMVDLAGKNFDGAERNFQIVLTREPNDLIALNNLAWIYHQKGDKRAREFAQRAFEQSPTPEVTDTLAWILTSQGEAAKALPLLQGATAARPDNPSIKYHLAATLKDLNRPSEAMAVLQPLVDAPASFDEKPAAQSLLAELTKTKP